MNLIRIILMVVLALAAVMARAEPVDQPYWIPDMATVIKIEQIFVMPKDARKPLDAYGRYYVGITKDGKRMIHGEFVMPQFTNEFPRIYLKHSEDDLPGIDDGGCSVINLLYDPAAEKIVFIECNGVA